MKAEQRGNIGGLNIRLRECRERIPLTREQVAKNLSISPSTIADYESGHRQPSLPILVGLAELYKVSTDFLLGVDTAEPPTPIDTTGLNDNQIDVLRHMIQVMKHG